MAHEWTHIERRDFRAWFAAGLARVLFFYQPLVWWLRRQLRLCQDFVADARASRQAPQPEDYAEFLTLRAAAGSLHPAMVGLGMGFRKSELYRRIVMLVQNPPLESRAPRLWTLSVTCAALILVAIVAALSDSPQASAQGDPAAQSEQSEPAAPSAEPAKPATQETEKAPLKKSATAKKIDFSIGPNKFAEGDKVTIEEVWSELGTLTKEDTVTVKGTYTLASHSKATLCLYVTEDASKKPTNYQPTTILSIQAGTSTFEFTRPIVCDGHLHLALYPEHSGSWFGNVYFGTEAQMKEIAHWDWAKSKETVPKQNIIQIPLPVGNVFRLPPSVETAESTSSTDCSSQFTVELIGLSENPSKGKSWWQPDGSSLAAPPYEELEGKLGGPENELTRELAIRVSPKLPANVGWTWRLDPTCTAMMAIPKDRGSENADLYGLVFRVPKDRKTISFQFGVADGPWEQLCESKGDLQTEIPTGPRSFSSASMKRTGTSFCPSPTISTAGSCGPSPSETTDRSTNLKSRSWTALKSISSRPGFQGLP